MLEKFISLIKCKKNGNQNLITVKSFNRPSTNNFSLLKSNEEIVEEAYNRLIFYAKNSPVKVNLNDREYIYKTLFTSLSHR